MNKFLATNNDEAILDEMLERQVNRFMVSYVNLYKKKYNHTGGLFQSPFKRINIEDEAYLQQAIIYVHANVLKHNLSFDYENYKYSSYQFIMKEYSNNIIYKKVVCFFGSIEKFILFHKEQIKYYYSKGFPNSKLE